MPIMRARCSMACIKLGLTPWGGSTTFGPTHDSHAPTRVRRCSAPPSQDVSVFLPWLHAAHGRLLCSPPLALLAEAGHLDIRRLAFGVGRCPSILARPCRHNVGGRSGGQLAPSSRPHGGAASRPFRLRRTGRQRGGARACLTDRVGHSRLVAAMGAWQFGGSQLERSACTAVICSEAPGWCLPRSMRRKTRRTS